jgi:hypothetical protein
MIGRDTNPMDQQLTAIERAQVGRHWLAETNHAEQPVVGGISDGDRVRKLFGGIHAVAMTHSNGRRAGRRRAGALVIAGDPGIVVLGRCRLCTAPQHATHHVDFLLLRDDDLLREPAKLLVALGSQLCLRHLDRANVMRNHHRREIDVNVTDGRRAHGRHHLRHRRVTLGHEPCVLAVALRHRRRRGHRDR